MSSTLPQSGGAILRANFPAGSNGSCYLWERSEVVREDAAVLTTNSWYELTFGDLPGRSVYADRLSDSSRIDLRDLSNAAALAAAWVETHRSRDTLSLRVEDQELAAQSRSAAEHVHEEIATYSEYLVWDVRDDGTRHVIAEANSRDEALRSAADFYVAHTLYVDAEPSLYLSQSRQDVGEPIPIDVLLSEARIEQLSPAMKRELSGLLAAQPDDQHRFQASALSTETAAGEKQPTQTKYELQVIHAQSIHQELECRVSQAIPTHGETSVVISFFNPIGGLPTVVNADYFGVKEAVRQAVTWVHDAGLKGPDENSWWPVLRQGSERGQHESLVGFVLGNDASRAKDVASWALDFGFGPEKLRVDLQPEKFPGLRDARYVMWTIDSEGVATNYTSDQALANVADVAARYEAIARAVDASAVAPFVSEWETSSEPPGQIRLPRANEPGEHLEFDLAVLGRQVPEREVELATDRSGKKAREGNNRWSDPNYIVWEENRDGTAKWRAVEMKLADARERAVKIAVGGRKKHGELSVTCITAWDPRQELPPRTVPATSLAVIGVPVEFDIHKEIHDRFPSRPPAIEPSKEPSDQMYDLHVICVQSTLEVKPGDYLQVREGKHGEPVGYLRGQGFGPDQVAAAPQYAVVRRDNNQVVAARYLEHEAQWAMERYVDADHEFMMGLERHHLPPVPDEQAQVHLPPNGTEQAVEPVRETPGLERSERLDEASLSSATQRRTDPDFER